MQKTVSSCDERCAHGGGDRLLADREVHGAFQLVARINPGDFLFDAADAIERSIQRLIHGEVPVLA